MTIHVLHCLKCGHLTHSHTGGFTCPHCGCTYGVDGTMNVGLNKETQEAITEPKNKLPRFGTANELFAELEEEEKKK